MMPNLRRLLLPLAAAAPFSGRRLAVAGSSLASRPFSSGDGPDDLGWDSAASPWSTGLTRDHFDGDAVGRQEGGEEAAAAAEMEREGRKSTAFVEGWEERLRETGVLLKQVMEPGARGSYLKDSEKAEMYRLHKAEPEVYSVERLAKDYRVMRQRVHAILWLKELEEEEEKKRGPLDDSVELLLDTCPE